MKKEFIALIACISLFCCESNTHKGAPVIHASSLETEYRIDDQIYKGWWSIAPHVEHDTLHVRCYQSPEKFVFKTDLDSISLDIHEGKSYDFYVKVNDSVFAHTIITGVTYLNEQIAYFSDKTDGISIKYEANQDHAYLKELRQKFPIEAKVSTNSNDTENALEIMNWTRNQWNHNGNVAPSKPDAITILEEVAQGKEFPCFAYAIVLKAQLENAGYKARTVYLKTKDAASRKSSPGHVVTEVYLNDLEKWVFLDAQFNAMPVLNNTPLNAVEFQDALTNEYQNLELRSLGTVSKREYADFVYEYLFYLDTSLDHRIRNNTNFKQHKIDSKVSLMLVPKGAPILEKIGFWNMNVDYAVYTHSTADFYAKP